MSRWSRWMPACGVLFVALLVASFALSGNTPGTDATGQQVISFYTAHSSKEQASNFLALYAVVFFVFFAAVLRAHLRRARPDGGALATASLGGAILVAVGGAIFCALGIALSDVPDKLDPGAAQALNVLTNDFFAPLIIGTCVFMIANGLAILRWEALPAWLGWVAIVIGVVAVTPVGFFAFLVTMAWVLVVSVLLLVRGGADRRRSPSTTAAPAA